MTTIRESFNEKGSLEKNLRKQNKEYKSVNEENVYKLEIYDLSVCIGLYKKTFLRSPFYSFIYQMKP